MQGKWIFNYGDFERHLGAKDLLSRDDKGSRFVAFYALPNTARSVTFKKHYELSEPEAVCVESEGHFVFAVDENRYSDAKSFIIPAGSYDINVFVGNIESLCALKISGKTVYTDESWLIDSYDGSYKPVGTSGLLDGYKGLPGNYEFPKVEIFPVSDKTENGERIIDFGKEVFVELRLSKLSVKERTDVFYGESFEELYSERCVIIDSTKKAKRKTFTARACRYVRFTGYTDFEIKAFYPKNPHIDLSSFSGDSELKKIYDISKYTLDLNSRIYLYDGIKRDRWAWCGDTYIVSKMNWYSFFDADIIRRSLIVLRGNRHVDFAVNCILEYGFYWFMTLKDYYTFTGDKEFILKNYDSAGELIKYYIKNTDKNGLLPHIENTWLFIDWHEIAKDGYNCAVQMLYCTALESMAEFASVCGKKEDEKLYKKLSRNLREKINEIFWSEKLGAYVSAYDGGKQIEEIRRHQNYFAILFGFADENRRERIIKNVVTNDSVPKITTPFFRFFEYDVLFSCGYEKLALEGIKKYWGGMIKLGATTVWEEFDENMSGNEHYAMYGEPFDKSLCHAWGAGPLYFIGRYLAGVRPLKPGYEKFEVSPLFGQGNFDITVPVNNGVVKVKLKDKTVSVFSGISGGTLVLGGQRYAIKPDKELTVSL